MLKEAVDHLLNELSRTKTGEVCITSTNTTYHSIYVFWRDEWFVRIGCQERSLARWLRYGNAVAAYHSWYLEQGEAEYLAHRINVISGSLGVPVPANAGEEEFDYDNDCIGDEDEDDDDDSWDDSFDDTWDEDYDDDDDDDWDED